VSTEPQLVPAIVPSAPPDLEFEVLRARQVRYAAAPMLALDLNVTEPNGREVYMVALTIQLMIEPARRAYDDETRERLLELFGAPERWAVTTRSLVWAQLDVIVPAFTGSTTVTVPISCHYDLELAATKYLYSLPGGMAPLALHFNGMIYYPNESGGLQIVLVPWTKSIDFRMPVSVWRETIEDYYPNTAWLALRAPTLEALQREKLNRGLATLDACVDTLLGEAATPPAGGAPKATGSTGEAPAGSGEIPTVRVRPLGDPPAKREPAHGEAATEPEPPLDGEPDA